MSNMDLSVSLLPVLNLFKWSGLWYPEDKDSPIYLVYQVCSFFVITVFLMAHNIFQAINIFSMYDDIPAVAQTFFVLIIELAAIVKIYCLLRNMDVIQNLVYKVLNQEYFQPSHQKHVEIFESTLNFWKKSFYFFITCGRLAVFLLGLLPIIDKPTERRLPYLAWYPFDYKISPNYEITFIHQMLSTVYTCQVNVAFDTFASGLFSHIGVQCDMLCNRLEHMDVVSRDDLQRRPGNASSEKDVIENKRNVLIKCINHHKKIVLFSKQVESLLNMGVFAQVVASVIIMCMTMLQMTLVKPMSPEFFAVVSYQASISVQWFMYCWFGNEVIYKSSNIPIALYKCDWVDNSFAFKKDLQFFMYRTQTPICIYTINYFQLSMTTFISIIQSAYSYYAVLRQVNEN